MPLFLPVECKVCSKGSVPADARFCRNCGRSIHWTETPAGRSRAVAVVAVVALAVVGVGLLLLLSVRHAGSAPRPVNVAAAGQPTAVPPASLTAPATVPATVPQTAHPRSVPAVASDVVNVPEVVVDAPRPLPSVPARPGDTDLTADPLAAYAGGPPADRLTVHGIRVGTPVSAVPVALLDDSEPDHLRDVDGNLYALDADHVVSEIHVRDPDLLARLPIDSTHALTGHFGTPGDVYTDADLSTYLYAARGVDVRWDAKAERIDELVLRRPDGGR